jgi:predicted CXXCH cytochrome family protein
MTHPQSTPGADSRQPLSFLHRAARTMLRLSGPGVLLLAAGSCLADVDLPTKFSDQASIGNTRHNLTQRQASGGGPTGVIMDPYRNDYGQVCVYCHTPHGANGNVAAPLWNRNIPNTTYTTYNQLGTSTSMTQPVYQPGAASLPCLSCHDGQQAVDAIINMPGSGRYDSSYNPGPTSTFLSSWSNPSTLGPFTHLALQTGDQGCLACHAPGSIVGSSATDFTAAAIGTDLRNDHPIGVTFPVANGSGTDWNTPGGSKLVGGRTTKFFDENSNGRMDKAEIRLYDSGNGAAVECASCHDPHGVASSGAMFNATFLRKPAGDVCLTCHAK